MPSHVAYFNLPKYNLLLFKGELLHSWDWVQEVLQITLEATHSSQLHEKQSATSSSLCEPSIPPTERRGEGSSRHDMMQASSIARFD